MSLTFPNTPIRITDPDSGIEMMQIVGGAESSHPLSYDWPSVTPDNRYAVINCAFAADSGRPSGFYRVATDGSEIAFVGDGGIHPRLTVDGKRLYLLRQGDPVLRFADVETGESHDVCNLERLLPPDFVYVQMRLSPPTASLVIMLRTPDIRPIRVNVETGEAVRLDDLDGMVWACMASEPRMVVVRQRRAEPGKLYDYIGYRKLELEPGDRSLWSADMDGGDARLICTDYYSHATIHGGTSSVQGCGKWGDRSITLTREGAAPRKVCTGPYFWHSGASFDGEWIAADTNWPDYGIQLMHVPTGNFRFLCWHGSSLKNGLAHAHPSLSFDGSIMLFRSDRSGSLQAYLVHIPEEFRRSVVAGQHGDRAPVWIPGNTT